MAHHKVNVVQYLRKWRRLTASACLASASTSTSGKSESSALAFSEAVPDHKVLELETSDSRNDME